MNMIQLVLCNADRCLLLQTLGTPARRPVEGFCAALQCLFLVVHSLVQCHKQLREMLRQASRMTAPERNAGKHAADEELVKVQTRVQSLKISIGMCCVPSTIEASVFPECMWVPVTTSPCCWQDCVSALAVLLPLKEQLPLMLLC